ncbi:MAG: threonine ammonia-lyase, partial [Candidatus Binatia bacterium]
SRGLEYVVSGELDKRETSPSIEGRSRVEQTAGPMVTLADIQAAARRLRPHLRRTPCVLSEALSEASGCQVYLKFENLQRTGSFKERGALNRLLQLPESERAKGVVTASAGNHAQALAHHATRLGIPSSIVMPRHTPINKITSTRRRGGKVILHGEAFDDALAHARSLAVAEGATFVHGFDDEAVVAGQGTLALELVEERIPLGAIVVPVGGGGLIAGCALALKSHDPAIRVIGVEPERCASMLESIRAGSPVTIESRPSIADGLAVKAPGAIPFAIVRDRVDELLTVSEEEVANAILVLLEVEKTMAEGAGAAGLAALLNRPSLRDELRGTAVVVPITGGNLDVNVLSRIIDRGLAKDGRLAKLRVFVPDRPGSLAMVSRLIADAGANVLDIFHVRAFAPTDVGEVALDFVLETRGHDHLEDVLRELSSHGLRPEHR